MRALWQSFTLAMAMYSRLPMPHVSWDEDAMRYVFCFFPCVGVAIGLCELLWFALAALLGVGNLLFAAVCVLIPTALTGGIHLDGFCDTCDALGSHQSRERKLEILKDSHIGAFALIGCCAWFLLDAALWSEVTVTRASACALALLPVLSRTLSGLCSVSMRNARGAGLLAAFTDASAKHTALAVLFVWLLVVSAALLLTAGPAGLAVLLGAGAALLIFLHMCRKSFGGITGDLAGWFLQVCELLCLAAMVLIQKGGALL